MENKEADNGTKEIVAAIDRLTDAVKNQTMAMQIVARKKNRHTPAEEE